MVAGVRRLDVLVAVLVRVVRIAHDVGREVAVHVVVPLEDDDDVERAVGRRVHAGRPRLGAAEGLVAVLRVERVERVVVDVALPEESARRNTVLTDLGAVTRRVERVACRVVGRLGAVVLGEPEVSGLAEEDARPVGRVEPHVELFREEEHLGRGGARVSAPEVEPRRAVVRARGCGPDHVKVRVFDLDLDDGVVAVVQRAADVDAVVGERVEDELLERAAPAGDVLSLDRRPRLERAADCFVDRDGVAREDRHEALGVEHREAQGFRTVVGVLEDARVPRTVLKEEERVSVGRLGERRRRTRLRVGRREGRRRALVDCLVEEVALGRQHVYPPLLQVNPIGAVVVIVAAHNDESPAVRRRRRRRGAAPPLERNAMRPDHLQ